MSPPDRGLLLATLAYDPATGVFTRRSSGERAGSVMKHGYRETSLFGARHYEHRLAWLYVHGYWPTLSIDHVNGDRADNRIGNLREATPLQQTRNSKIPRHNTSGIKGVAWDRVRCKWYAFINIEGRMHSLGRHDSIEEAAAARAAAERRVFGEFARAA